MSFDVVGNLFGVAGSAVTPGAGYSYDALGRLIWAEVGSAERSYHYDHFGNLTAVDATSIPVDHQTNRLGGAGYSPWGTMECREEGSGWWRHTQHDLTGALAGVWGTGNEKTPPPADTYAFVTGPDGDRTTVVRLEKGVVHALVCDHLGSVRAEVLVNEDGQPGIHRAGYRPYGEAISPALAPSEGHRFTAHWREYRGTVAGASVLDGLDFMHAREYDWRLGRFTAPDPAGSSWNTYAYVLGNPVNLVDPWGPASNLPGPPRSTSGWRGTVSSRRKRVSGAASR